METTVMIIGLGDLGGVTLELLARSTPKVKIVATSRNARRSEARCNLARLGAAAQGFAPDIRFVPLDLNYPEAVAETIHIINPDLILFTASLQTWWLPELLPPECATRIKSAGFGIWLPIHLALPIKMMQALKMADYQGLTLMAPFPDVVNCILGRMGFAPTCGIGNLSEIIPKVQLKASRKLGVSLNEIRVTLVAHHALEAFVFEHPHSEGGKVPPFYLHVEHNGQDVTDKVHARQLLLSPYPISSGPAWHFLTAGSTVRLIQALTSEDETRLHAPGPSGLPGGYPIIASRAGVTIPSISGLSLEEAIEINERSHPFDGIDRIDPDGVVTFSTHSIEVMREEFGYNCERLSPEEAAVWARELMTRFKAYANRKGIQVTS